MTLFPQRQGEKYPPPPKDFFYGQFKYFRYRLAPKHPFPIPFQDCVDAALYFFEHATDYGVDPKRVALAGEPRTEGKPSNLLLELSLSFRCVRIFFC